MNTTELLKEKIIESRLMLATLMNNASQKMDDASYNLIEARVKQLHLYDLNQDFEMSLSETNKLVEELENYEHE